MDRRLKHHIVIDGGITICNHLVNHIPFWIIRKKIYKKMGLTIGKNSRICQGVIIMRPKNIVIGENTIINDYALLDGRGGLEIGNNTSISMYAKIYTGTHETHSSYFKYISKKTIIEDNCWLGTNSIILPGSVIKDYSIIGVNSVFKGISEKKGIYIGNFAKLVKYRDISEKYTLNWKPWFR